MKKNTLILFLFITLVFLATYLYFTKDSGTIRKELSDFAVEDTASISKIFLVDNAGKSILLERKNDTEWILNGKYIAREDAVNGLLIAVKRITVKTPVPKTAFENVVKQIAASHVKIEIYLQEEKPAKSYYVGHNNPDHNGTYMLLENSSVPFLMHIEGFRGFLSPRYFTNENEWRSTAIFSYGYGEISSIKLEYPEKPGNSFIITDAGNVQFRLTSLETNTDITPYDTAALVQYMALFKKIHFEGFEETKKQSFKDSVLSAIPMQIFTVTDKSGRTKTLKTFLKPPPEGATNIRGEPLKSDLDRFYGWIDDKDFVVLQYFVFDPLIKTIEDFK